jgi:hypothetical protein
LQCTFANKFKVIDITNSAILEDIKACLWSRDRWVTLEFANEEDESRESSRINGENDGNKEDKSRKSSGINKENNSKSEDD